MQVSAHRQGQLTICNLVGGSIGCRKGEMRRRGGPENGNHNYKGVRQRTWGSWVSEIRDPHHRTRVWLGSYNTARDAALAYDRAARMILGPNAYVNFPVPPHPNAPDQPYLPVPNPPELNLPVSPHPDVPELNLGLPYPPPATTNGPSSATKRPMASNSMINPVGTEDVAHWDKKSRTKNAEKLSGEPIIAETIEEQSGSNYGGEEQQLSLNKTVMNLRETSPGESSVNYADSEWLKL